MGSYIFNQIIVNVSLLFMFCKTNLMIFFFFINTYCKYRKLINKDFILYTVLLNPYQILYHLLVVFLLQSQDLLHSSPFECSCVKDMWKQLACLLNHKGEVLYYCFITVNMIIFAVYSFLLFFLMLKKCKKNNTHKLDFNTTQHLLCINTKKF